MARTFPFFDFSFGSTWYLVIIASKPHEYSKLGSQMYWWHYKWSLIANNQDQMFFKNSLKVSHLGDYLPSPLLLFLLKLPHPPPPLQEALLGTVAAQVQHLKK